MKYHNGNPRQRLSSTGVSTPTKLWHRSLVSYLPGSESQMCRPVLQDPNLARLQCTRPVVWRSKKISRRFRCLEFRRLLINSQGSGVTMKQ